MARISARHAEGVARLPVSGPITLALDGKTDRIADVDTDAQRVIEAGQWP